VRLNDKSTSHKFSASREYQNSRDICDALIQDLLEDISMVQDVGIVVFGFVWLNNELFDFPSRRHSHLFRKTLQQMRCFPILKTSFPIFIAHSPREFEMETVSFVDGGESESLTLALEIPAMRLQPAMGSRMLVRVRLSLGGGTP
jgi:hypothetical protein